MRCEVCGHNIYGKPYRVLIEGAKLTVCSHCSKHGRVIWEEEKPKTTTLKTRTAVPPLRIQSKKSSTPAVDTTQELVENFHAKIRQAREKLGISHEELGKKINEKVSVLRKIETGKMTPDNILVAKLEHRLKIKLLVLASEEKIKIPKPSSRELTLGDLININEIDEKKEEQEERKRS